MNVLQWIMVLVTWPVAIGVVLTLWANRATMFPMTWTKDPEENVWKLELDDLEATAYITMTVPHEAEVHFGRGDLIHIERMGTFLKWDDAARMTEHWIEALREVERA